MSILDQKITRQKFFKIIGIGVLTALFLPKKAIADIWFRQNDGTVPAKIVGPDFVLKNGAKIIFDGTGGDSYRVYSGGTLKTYVDNVLVEEIE